MNRRRFLKISGGTALAGLSGCSQSSEPSSSKSSGDEASGSQDSHGATNPWNQDTLTVGLDQQVSARHDIQEIIDESLSYWEENSSVYAGYSVSYQYRPNAEDPDIQITLLSEITECGEHSGDEIAGCAPLILSGPPETADVKIVDGYRKDWMVSTLKHEIGHTLGLDHDAEPAHIMSNQIDDRIPDYEKRRQAIEAYTASADPYSSASDSWSEALDAWENKKYAETSSHATEARVGYETSRDNIESAMETVEDLEEPEALGYLEEAHRHIELVIDSVEYAVKMANAASQENYDQSETYLEKSNTARDKARNHDIDHFGDFVVALGFPEPDEE